MATITNGIAGGAQVSGAPLTLETINAAAPGLLQNSIDERIVRVRPMSTPIDQLSRCAASRRASAMTVEYYSVDTKQTEATLKTKYQGGIGVKKSDNMFAVVFKTDNDAIFEASETVLVPDVLVAGGEPLVLYVRERLKTGGLELAPLNYNTDDEGDFTLPEIPAGTRLVRMGRAATELDVQTAQFSALPRKASNNCQIFKMQVEQSTLAKIARKEVGWNFSDQEEAAIIDMRLGMEKNFLFGCRTVLFDPDKNENIYLTGGIWNQTKRTHALNLDTLKEADLIDLCAAAFTGNNGSKRKILIAGTGLMNALSKLQYSKVLSAFSRGAARVRT